MKKSEFLKRIKSYNLEKQALALKEKALEAERVELLQYIETYGVKDTETKDITTASITYNVTTDMAAIITFAKNLKELPTAIEHLKKRKLNSFIKEVPDRNAITKAFESGFLSQKDFDKIYLNNPIKKLTFKLIN